MQIQDLTTYKNKLKNTSFTFRAELFNKAIWGDMGEDSAQITITIDTQHDAWHLAFIRTQSGDPSPFDDFVCNVIDEYEKDMQDAQLYDTLAMHSLLSDFERTCKDTLEK